jgi:hypothetical protein
MCILGNLLWKMKTSFYLPSFMSIEDSPERVSIHVSHKRSREISLL